MGHEMYFALWQEALLLLTSLCTGNMSLRLETINLTLAIHNTNADLAYMIGASPYVEKVDRGLALLSERGSFSQLQIVLSRRSPSASEVPTIWRIVEKAFPKLAAAKLLCQGATIASRRGVHDAVIGTDVAGRF